MRNFPPKIPWLQDAGLTKAYIFAAMMFVAPVVGTLCAGQSNRLSIGTQIMVRSELTASIYRKALRLRWDAGTRGPRQSRQAAQGACRGACWGVVCRGQHLPQAMQLAAQDCPSGVIRVQRHN